MRAMEVKPDAQRETASGFTRQSNRSYTFFFVGNGWTSLPPEGPAYVWTWWNWLLLAVVLALAIWVVWRSRKSHALENRVQESVRKLRAGRQRTAAKPDAAPEAGPAAEGGPPPPAAT
jgi:uncharacterized membrane protein YdbT with pleckstrin-like domain